MLCTGLPTTLWAVIHRNSDEAQCSSHNVRGGSRQTVVACQLIGVLHLVASRVSQVCLQCRRADVSRMKHCLHTFSLSRWSTLG